VAEASTSGSPSGGTSGSTEIRRSEGGSGDSVLMTSRGQTSIEDVVVTKVASVATREVRGVHSLGGGVSRTLGSVAQRVGVGDERTQGVSVEVGEREAAVDLVVVIDYGESIPQVSQAIRDNIIKRIEGITGLHVTEVNVTVNDLFFPGDEQPDQPARVA
jgi:uncharacterized alkaline shock family protein YloU